MKKGYFSYRQVISGVQQLRVHARRNQFKREGINFFCVYSKNGLRNDLRNTAASQRGSYGDLHTITITSARCIWWK